MLLRLCKALIGGFVFPVSISAATPVALDLAHPNVRAVMSIQHEVTSGWMAHPEVLGTAIVLDENGAPALGVYIDQDAAGAADMVRNLPTQIRGVKVQVRLTDKFRALRRHRHRRGGGGSLGHRGLQTPPIQLGTSGSWIHDTTGNSCCVGTLGALVQIGGQQYVLSNWHVFEMDTAPGKNGVVATTGDAVIQPGLADVNCTAADAQAVATLELRHSLPSGNTDCAVAKVIPGMVRTDGVILEIGPLSAQTVGAFLNQPVKKSGRTTGLTRQVVIGLNASIVVEYDDECGGNFSFNKTFTGQIMVGNRRSNFLDGGDSGSLLVEDAATNPRAIGLLFAGSGSDAIANPINDVLSFLGASMVGN